MTMMFDHALVIFYTVFFFGFCIFIHEFGHLLAALWRGLRVERFSIGFGPKIWGVKIKGVDYILSLLPFGGYVALPQIDHASETPKAADGTILPRIKPVDNILTSVAGPVFNLLFGFFLATIVWWVGVRMPYTPAYTVVEVPESSPEYTAGLRPGDQILEVNGRHVSPNWMKVQERFAFSQQDVRLKIRHGEETRVLTYPAVPPPDPLPGAEGLPLPQFSVHLPSAVVEVAPDSPAALAGLQLDDEIVLVNGKRAAGPAEYGDLMRKTAGQPATLVLNRKGQPLTVSMTAKPVPVYFALVVENRPAALAGFRNGDELVALNGEPVKNALDFREKIRHGDGKPLQLDIRRDGKTLTLSVTPAADTDANGRTIYQLGVIPAHSPDGKRSDTFALFGLDLYWPVQHPTPWAQFTNVFTSSRDTLGALFSRHSKVGISNLSGPAGIVSLVWTSFSNSFVHGLFFVALISFSLGMLNLLPIPVLDGGHILISLIESLVRRPLPPGLVNPVQYACAILLIGFMLSVTFFDVRRLWYPAKPAPRPAHQEQTVPPPAATGTAQTAAPRQ